MDKIKRAETQRKYRTSIKGRAAQAAYRPIANANQKVCYARAERKTARRFTKIKHLYGINREDYQNLWDAQMGQCDICGAHFEGAVIPVVDHDHRYGNNWWAVRALLCLSCNGRWR